MKLSASEYADLIKRRPHLAPVDSVASPKPQPNPRTEPIIEVIPNAQDSSIPPAAQLWEEYQKAGSVHRVARLHGIWGQKVKDILNRAGYRLNNSDWTDGEVAALRDYYKTTPPSAFSIQSYADSVHRTFASIALKASRLGLCRKRTDPHTNSDSSREKSSASHKARAARVGGAEIAKGLLEYMKTHEPSFKGKTHTQEYKAAMSVRVKALFAKNGHPRGMLGKKHSEETKAKISELLAGRDVPRERVVRGMRTRAEKGTLCRQRVECSWKSGWCEVGEKRFYARSSWEANYSRYLQWLKENGEIAEWEHEPETFWFEGVRRGCVSYLPDFKVTLPNSTVEFHEVKGWMDARSKTKIRRMAKYHPAVVLKVIDGKAYTQLKRNVSSIVKGWV